MTDGVEELPAVRAEAGGDALDAGALDGEPLTVVHPRVEAAFQALDDAGLVWALLRGAEDLARPTGDVDVLVDAAALPRLDRVLAAAGLARMGVRGHGGHRFYFGYDRLGQLWIKLDIVPAVAFGRFQELASPLAAGALQRRERRGGLWRLAAPDEAWLVLLHLLLDKGRIAAERRDLARTAAERATATAPIAEFLDHRVGPGTAGQVLDAVRDAVRGADPAGARALAVDLARRWPGARRSRVAARRFGGRLARRLDLPVPGHPAGSVVAVVGPDGAGKTTLITALRASYPSSIRSVYMGLWRESRADRLLRALPGGRLAQRTGRLVRSSTTARVHRRLGRLVVLDRFAYDALLPGDRDTSVGGRIIAAAAQRLGPEPDLVLILDAPGELLFARKGEHTAELLEQRRQGYLQLAGRFRDTVVLDATQPAAEVLRRTLAALWSRLSRP